MKIKHYYVFDKSVSDKFYGDSLNEKNWNILRSDEHERAFSIEKVLVNKWVGSINKSVLYPT